jgi:hypothetical protein
MKYVFSILSKSTLFVILIYSALFRSHASAEMCFLVIYIAEAHARDQWPVGKTISCVDQPITIEQRLENARQCKKNFNFEIPMLVDNMDNTFHLTYGSWPFRFYVIHDGKLALKAEPHKENFCYNIDELNQWLDNFYSSRNPVA